MKFLGDSQVTLLIQGNKRPYQGAEEFLRAYKEHGPFLKRPSGEYVGSSYVSDTGIFLLGGTGFIEYEYLREKYCWQDGTPCETSE